MTTKVAIIGSGNIGTDLMIKIMRCPRRWRWRRGRHRSGVRRAGQARRAAGRGHHRTRASTGCWRCRSAEIGIVFDATSAGAHARHNDSPARARQADDRSDARGDRALLSCRRSTATTHLDAPNVNMVTCGGQATIPIVAAVSRVAQVSTPRSSPRSPRSRPGRAPAPISTSSPKPPRKAIEVVGGARRGKAIIILNPAEPPLIMRDTVFACPRTPIRRRHRRARSRPWSPRCRPMSRATG